MLCSPAAPRALQGLESSQFFLVWLRLLGQGVTWNQGTDYSLEHRPSNLQLSGDPHMLVVSSVQ